jgi:hypothetical protein
MVHICNPSYPRGTGRSIVIWGQTGKILSLKKKKSKTKKWWRCGSNDKSTSSKPWIQTLVPPKKCPSLQLSKSEISVLRVSIPRLFLKEKSLPCMNRIHIITSLYPVRILSQWHGIEVTILIKQERRNLRCYIGDRMRERERERERERLL